MPWTASDAHKHTSKANTFGLQKQWAATANRVLSETGDEGRAIREANAVIAERSQKRD